MIAGSYLYIDSHINLKIISLEVAEIFMALPLIYGAVNRWLSPKILSLATEKSLLAFVFFEAGIIYFYMAVFLILVYGAHQSSLLIYVNIFSLMWTKQLPSMFNAFIPTWGKKADKNFLEQGYWQFYMQEIQARGDCIIVPSSSYMAFQVMLIISYLLKYLVLAVLGCYIFKTWN